MLTGGALAVTFENGEGGKALVLLNPGKFASTYDLGHDWQLIADGNKAGISALASESGIVTVRGLEVRIYVNDVLIP